tara:strand:- start:790 stop:1161 length:372 start_codon:yes stop_codon:yes gene_type:complete
MSEKITPRLPLLNDESQPGFELIDNIRDLIKQNMKMVILTNPGERVMIPDFGVGITGMLFENLEDEEVLSHFKGRIKQQVNTYLPYVELVDIIFSQKDIDENKISTSIRYYIPDLDFEEVLDI